MVLFLMGSMQWCAVCVWYLLAACGIVCVAAAPAPIHPPGEAEGWPAAAARETESLCYPGGGVVVAVVVVVVVVRPAVTRPGKCAAPALLLPVTY